MTLLAVNRSTGEDLELTADVRAFPGYRIAGASTLATSDLRAANTAEDPEAVRPRENTRVRLADGRLEASLPPVSWNVLRLEPGIDS